MLVVLAVAITVALSGIFVAIYCIYEELDMLRCKRNYEIHLLKSEVNELKARLNTIGTLIRKSN